MSDHDAWQAATLDLIHRLETDRLPKAEHRLVSAQRAVAMVKAEIDALHLALKVYREEHGLSVEPAQPDERQVAPYVNRGAREMLQRWADDHGGQVVMRDAAYFLVSAGIFRDYTQAAGALYPAIGRADGFVKIARGAYRFAP